MSLTESYFKELYKNSVFVERYGINMGSENCYSFVTCYIFVKSSQQDKLPWQINKLAKFKWNYFSKPWLWWNTIPGYDTWKTNRNSF